MANVINGESGTQWQVQIMMGLLKPELRDVEVFDTPEQAFKFAESTMANRREQGLGNWQAHIYKITYQKESFLISAW